MVLNKDELEYYSKNIELKEIGLIGQKKLKESRVLVIGAGGLGCPALIYLTTAGVGNIGIVDFDTVSVSNLHRQILYTYDDIGNYKSEVAKIKLSQINPFINLKSYIEKIDAENIEPIIADYDYILDCPDNLKTRYLIEEYATKTRKNIIFGPLTGIIGDMMAIECIKNILSLTDKNHNLLTQYDSKRCELKKIKIKKNANCNVCNGD